VPISIFLHKRRQIIELKVTDPVQIHDLFRLFNLHQRYLDRSPCRVHLLLNVEQAELAPVGLTHLCQLRESPALIHSNTGIIAVVGAMSSIEALGRLIFRMNHFTRGYFLSTEQEAWKLLSIIQPEMATV
jgi:hypothetical protein